MTGMNSSISQMDPLTRRTTILLQKVGELTNLGRRGNPIYRQLPYSLVSYDGDPTQYIEPELVSDFAKVLDGSGDPINPLSDAAGRITAVLYVTSRPFEVFSYNDFDAVNNGGQLP